MIRNTVLDDPLFRLYNAFLAGEGISEKDIPLLKDLLHYINGVVLSNIGQYEKNGIPLDANLKSQMAHAGLKRQTLEELAEIHSTYKIILTADDAKKGYPYVNIKNKPLRLENNYTASYDIAESRADAIDHIARLCKHAKEVEVYDKYFSAKPGNVDLLKQLLPKKKLTIKISDLTAAIREELEKWHDKWTVERHTGLGRHDRYLVIDGSLEVILSSGFDHLGDTSGDLTYILRPIDKSRFAPRI